eukprot:CAMPEP_0172742302 /NCGR_PEP_ID=MMETSP1074-20121228/129213_1 /TAXON_ID=2916 /ORGANISM="Ceratium fusus, Strain PA161109" /LENGTH=226 /DNA_ID=CAMNT_0013572821 /DNA_START=3 /DNA_END=680 /DNA_ORIENTATION=+
MATVGVNDASLEQRLPFEGRDVQSQGVPHREQQVLISWVFIFASGSLFLDFASLQQLSQHGPGGTFAGLCNWFGTVSCLLWLLGFVILVHWLRRVGATAMGVSGARLKLLAALFFNIQPMTGVAGINNGAGVWWSNLVGILLFHLGNLVSCLDFFLHPPPGSDKSHSWLAHGNLPITGMWIYQVATWLLVLGNLLACNWWAESPTAQWVPTTHWLVVTGQYAGSLL